MIPRALRNFKLFVEGVGYAGLCTECELPEFALKTEETRGGGQDSPIEIDLGVELMTSKLTFNEYLPEVVKLVGKLGANAARVQLRGALQRDREAAVPMVVTMHGGFKSDTMGSWKAGDLASYEAEMTLRYLKIEIAGENVREIDVDNMIRRLGGEDVLATIRDAIGA